MAIPKKHRDRAGRGVAFLLGVIITAIIGGAITYHFLTKSNTEMVIQQQQVADLSQFGSSASSLDNSVRQFSDALVAGKGVEAARSSLNGAIGSHSAFVFNTLRSDLDAADYTEYMSRLNRLRETAQTAQTYQDGVRLWQETADLISFRKHMTDRVNARIRAS